ncbi:MAG: S8 family serine peptidase, partial [Bacteroidota bacterium]|nr:S8 family serine peptidase [Bacteroidota bacterium]
RKPRSQLESHTNSSTVLIQLEHEGTVQDVIRELIEMDIVEHAEPNYLLKHDDDLIQEYEPIDPLFQYQWGLKNTGNAVAISGSLVGSPGSDINATNAWDITTGSSSIIVAVIDDGIDPAHPEFIGKIINGYDFVGDDTDPTSQNGDFHGNACAGIIAAAADDLGTVGVAPGVRLMPLRVCNSVGCSSSSIIDAIYYAVDNGARVISISLGGDSFSGFMEEAINYAVFHNVVVFASAGNDNEDNSVNSHYPSGYINCISVGAMSPCGERKTPSTCDGETWWGSNYGDLDFITPGTRIYSTDISGAGGYNSEDYLTHFNGTSAACPHAAGVAALILSIDPSLSSLQVRQFMQQGSVDIGAAGYDAQSGYGRLDAHLGLQMVQAGGLDQLIISNQGNADLTISSISDDMTWMTLSHSTVPLVLHAGGSMIVDVNVDWNLISATETGHITISSDDADEGSVVVDVTASPQTVGTYMITAEANPPSGGFIEGAGEKGVDQDVILTASPASTYDFVSWTENGIVVSTDQVYSFVATSDRHLVANFELKSFTVSASANPSSGGTVSGAGTYDYGDMATLTATPAEGYTFTNWSIGEMVLSTNAVYSFSVTENLALTANFSMEYYSITASVEPEGTGTVTGTGAYTHNQTVQLQAVAASGYEFDAWMVAGVAVSSSANYSFAAVADLHLVASFSVQSLDVTTIANPMGAGTISGGGTYSYGSQASLLATPSQGFEFVNWTIDDIEVSTNPAYNFNVYQNSVVVANFKTESSLTIQTSSVPSEGGITAGGGQFVFGDLVILAAVPAEGYQLAYWIDENDVVLSDNNPYSFTAVEDAHIKAVFLPENTTGTEPVEEEHPFELYPNPVGDYLYVRFNIDLSRSAVISLYDANGKMIANYKTLHHFKDVIELNTSQLFPGMYFIRVIDHDTDARFTGKFIKR